MFQVFAQDPESQARRGRLVTAHGVVETPIFMPVGTRGSVKAVSSAELRALEAQIILGNTYHLWLRPGMETIRHFGGLHRFMNWDGPILTDSGGFQVFSLAGLRKIEEDGVRFQSHLDGTSMFLSPEVSMEIQSVLGSDIVMAFDECPPYPCERDYAARSLALTLRWEERSRRWFADHADSSRQKLFAIVQGATYADLREESAKRLVGLDFDGYAIGGVSVGEPEEEMLRAVENSVPFLPPDKPRYAMGLGQPDQLLEMIARGVDMFDCVLPTRVARHGTAYTEDGTLNFNNQRFALEDAPISENTHPLCAGYSRGYIRHLVTQGEILGLRLLTLHNLHFYLSLMERARRAIDTSSFAGFRESFVSRFRAGQRTTGP
ncbi:MAG: queuine tRNA-ribosyltransferase [Verrucomicrobia bacterium]|jgi:queuine tRNA-ribosyltransferase|nr:MAG: queuine tRNA-ribosyltransferase [Verrucomicrobiota bacterium]